MDERRLALEAERIRLAYARWNVSRRGKKLYDWNQPDVALSRYLLQSAVARLLGAAGWSDLAQREFLDVGCGTGGWLRTLQEWGASPQRLHGVDLLTERIEKARGLAPHIDLQVSPGWPLPFESGSMDCACAFTVFSSVLDAGARSRLAEEMRRVVRPTGLILLYDFWISDPRNPDTIGIGLAEVRRLFPGHRIRRRSVTLAPPLQRRLCRASPTLSHLIEAVFPFLRTHALYLIERREGGR